MQCWFGVKEYSAQRVLLVRGNDDTTGASPPEPVRDSSALRRSQSSIDPEEFQRFLEHATQLGCGEPQSLRSWLDLAEAWQITRALRLCRGNRSAAARALGIGRRTLYAKMDKLSITASWGV